MLAVLLFHFVSLDEAQILQFTLSFTFLLIVSALSKIGSQIFKNICQIF